MAKVTCRLTALKISYLKKGYHHDGQGLYLQVSESGAKSWILKFNIKGVRREMGLGSFQSISLGEARIRRDELRHEIALGNDPIQTKRQCEVDEKNKSLSEITFRDCSKAYIEFKKSGWANAKHAKQWESTLSSYAFPVIGALSVNEIKVEHIIKILQPIWNIKTETASRVRNRIELVLNWAKAREFRFGENPAAWRGHLDQIFPKRSAVQKVKHMAALPYRDVPVFYKKLEETGTIESKALQFTILTGARTNEVTRATWDEISMLNKVWVIPASRTKTKREHRIPLCDIAMNLLSLLSCHEKNAFIFKNKKNNLSIGNFTMLELLKKHHLDLTVHGFRSSFRDWVGEETDFSGELAESALGHSLRNKVEAAYKRGDFLFRRRALMTEWANFCTSGILNDRSRFTGALQAV